MPTYDYKCKKCNHTFEEFHKMNENPKIKCPKCGNIATKLISVNSGIIFKGSGFYVTDYKNNSSKEKKTTDTKKTPKSNN